MTQEQISAGLPLIACLLIGVASDGYLKKNHTAGRLIKSRVHLIIGQGLLFAVLVSVASKYFFHLEMLMVIACVAAFLLPACVGEACLAFRGMPGVAVIIWQTDDEQQRPEKRVQYKKDLSIQFVLRKKAGGSTLATVTHEASKYDLLGHAFNQFTSTGFAEVESQVDMMDAEGDEFDWAFYTPDFLLGKRWLDPYATIRQNNIQKGKPVFVKRIKTSSI